MPTAPSNKIIEHYTFETNSFEEVYLPEGLQYIGAKDWSAYYGPFCYCEKIKYINIPFTILAIDGGMRNGKNQTTPLLTIDMTMFDSSHADFHIPSLNNWWTDFIPTTCVILFKNQETLNEFAKDLKWKQRSTCFKVKGT